jgi:hypothetical protein
LWTVGIVILIAKVAAAAISPTKTTIPHSVLDAGEGNVEGRLLLLLISHRGLQGRKLVR